MSSVAKVALPIIGGIGGFMLGGPMGAALGANLGWSVAGALLPTKRQNIRLPTKEGPRLADLRVQKSAYGSVIPKLYGTMRLSGNVLWCMDIKETRHEHTESFTQRSGGKGGGGRRSVTTTQTSYSYSYSVTLAIGICEGKIDEIKKIWADSKLLTNNDLGKDIGKFNVHLGCEQQMQDDIIAKYKGNSDFPAYRGLCYVVIEDFPLEQFGNRIPSFSFEVKRIVKQDFAVENKIREVILIPGSGEFVYSDTVHIKKTKLPSGTTHLYKALNMHNTEEKANLLVALDQMQQVLANLEWVGVVVTWFATSTNAGKCRIIPKVEFAGDESQITEPYLWNVAGLNRKNAEKVLSFVGKGDVPTYGGTPNDQSIIALCNELKKRGLKIMLYPMIFVDELEPKPKPWRGRIKANTEDDIKKFFTAPDGYNRFIMHYANLVGQQVDAFIIGSEMIGLTGFTEKKGVYPAVDQFVSLAKIVKNVVGNNCKVTYAADWSEYHHTKDGWYNMDKLWSCIAIDFIGIDAYFPLTEDLPQKQITEELIKAGWESGEGWDYYCDGEKRIRRKLDKKYAWKNLEYWWKNKHTNPDGKETQWIPKSKPVWFTELGFPTVDACSNQPNVFFDPFSVESNFPRGSLGRVDFFAQRQALHASLDYLEQRNNRQGLQELVPKRFVWTWDARPYPAWPDYREIWSDCHLWKRGHWINGKLGRSTLASIVEDLLKEVGLSHSQYDTSRLVNDVDGYIIAQHITAREALEQLQAAYFFDCLESDGILKFIPRINRDVIESIQGNDLVTNDSTDVKETIEVNALQQLELPEKVTITHIDQNRDYDTASISSKRQTINSREQVATSLPISMNHYEAKQIADITLYNAWEERINYSFTLPPKYAYLEPTDIITVTADNITHTMRIVKIDMQRNGQTQVIATHYNVDIYDFHSDIEYVKKQYQIPQIIAETWLEVIDAPPIPGDESLYDGIIRFAVFPQGDNWQGTAIYTSLDAGYDYRLTATVDNPSIIGFAQNILPAAASTIFDNSSELIIQLVSGCLSGVSKLSLLGGSNAALIGNELIQFKNAELIADNTYKLTTLLRGRQGTEEYIDKHQKKERFVLLNSGLSTSVVNSDMIDREALYKPVSVGKSLAETNTIPFTYSAKNLKPFAPVHLRAKYIEEDKINISWIRRARYNNGWRDNIDVPIGEENEKYQVDIMQNAQLITTIESDEPNIIWHNKQKLNNLTAHIYQLSSLAGRGYGATITL